MYFQCYETRVINGIFFERVRDSLWNQVKLVFCHRYVALFSKMVGWADRNCKENSEGIFLIFLQRKISYKKEFSHTESFYVCNVSKLFLSIFFATQQNVYSAMSTQTSVYCRKTAEMYSVVLHTKHSRNIAHTPEVIYFSHNKK